MMTDECLFCRIAAGQVPATKIFEDEVVLAFLDIGPLSDGHTLVIPKQHFQKLHDCPPELLAQVGCRVGKVAKVLTRAIDCDGYNVLCNNGRAAGQLVNHLHFHIIPRKAGDGLFGSWPAYKYQEGKCEAIAVKIRKEL